MRMGRSPAITGLVKAMLELCLALEENALMLLLFGNVDSVMASSMEGENYICSCARQLHECGGPTQEQLPFAVSC